MDYASAGELMIVEREVEGRTVFEFRSVGGHPRCDLENVDVMINWLSAARDRRLARTAGRSAAVPEQRRRVTPSTPRLGRARALLSLFTLR